MTCGCCYLWLPPPQCSVQVADHTPSGLFPLSGKEIICPQLGAAEYRDREPASSDEGTEVGRGGRGLPRPNLLPRVVASGEAR